MRRRRAVWWSVCLLLVWAIIDCAPATTSPEQTTEQPQQDAKVSTEATLDTTTTGREDRKGEAPGPEEAASLDAAEPAMDAAVELPAEPPGPEPVVSEGTGTEPTQPESEPVTETQPAQPVLLKSGHLVHEGVFRVPSEDNGSPKWTGLNYGGTALTFDPDTKTLYLVGHDHHQLATEIDIPKIVQSSDINQLARAKFLQAFADPTEGNLSKVDDGTVKIGGLLVYNQQLFGTAYSYYDADGNQKLSSFLRAKKLSQQGSFKGFYQVGSVGAGFVSGYMTLIPQEWRAKLGGPALVGQCCIPIVSRTSYGPAASVFDPADLGQKQPAPATPLVYYTSQHPLGEWGKTGTLFNGSTAMAGLVLPKGSRSLLFFGRQGTGAFCYGTGQDCNDPTDSSKGNHAYPYIHQVWAYDLDDLLAVKQGTKKPWEVKPYQTWELKLPFSSGSRVLQSVAYDPASQRIFIAQRNTDGDRPLIHVLKVKLTP